MSKVKKGYSRFAIYRVSYYGPCFAMSVTIGYNAGSNITRAYFRSAYPAPPAVQDRFTVLAGTPYFPPDEVEVFYLDPSR